MSFRRDKLILLVDTGTSPHVRRTAAKQLADLTLKAFLATTQYQPKTEETKEDIKPDIDSNGNDQVTLTSGGNEEDAWNDVLETISKVLPLLKSKVSDTRHAAAYALGLLASHIPEWSHPITSTIDDDSLSIPINLPELLKTSSTLLASAGREYIAKPLPGDKAKRRKAMMGSLGLGDAVGWGDDVDKVIGDEDEDMNGENKDQNGSRAGPSREPSAPPPPPQNIFEGLSARQITMLKRKKGNMVEEANKMRKMNEKASGSVPNSAAPSPVSTPPELPTTSSVKAEDVKPEVVTIDPGAKARIAAQAGSGGQVEPIVDTDGNPIITSSVKILNLIKGQSPWTTVLSELSPKLHEPVWQIRHGSALAIMEILRSLGSSYASSESTVWLNLSRHLLSLLVLDRFGDFVGDTVIAPVRETAAQALGIVLKYIDITGVKEIHTTLMGMVKQPWAKRGKAAEGLDKSEKFTWEVRHAGLLGLKYEVAVKGELLGTSKLADVKMEGDVKPDIEATELDILKDVVEAGSLALGDSDDDVRTVAATALTPIPDIIASKLLEDDLHQLLTTLWACLTEGGDELGSSTGAVMDLLGVLLKQEQVVEYMTNSKETLATRAYKFMRHPIAAVRLSVIKILLTVGENRSINKEWLTDDYASFLFQNVLLEERQDIRELSLKAFDSAFQEISEECGEEITLMELDDWFTLVMTPIGAPFDSTLFRKAKNSTTGHNVDKAMMAGDMSLVSMNIALQTRLTGAKALGMLRRFHDDEENDIRHLQQYLSSASAHQVLMGTAVIQERALHADQHRTPKDEPISLGISDDLIQPLVSILIDRVGSPPPATYHEMSVILQRIYTKCHALLNAFNVEGKVSKDRIPSLPSRIDPLSTAQDVFSLATAQQAIGPTFEALSKLLTKPAQKVALTSLRDRQRKIMGSIGYFAVMKERYDTQVMAGIASALVALRVMPQKLGPVIKSLMDAVKKEENEILQSRAASSVAAFVEYTTTPLFTGRVNPSDKVIGNLFAFLCSDTSITPIFAPNSTAISGIITLKEEKASAANATKKGPGKDMPEENEEQIAARITRRGALEAFKALANKFGDRLVDGVPRFWQGISAALLANFASGTNIEEIDQRLSGNVQAGQDIIDCLTSLRLIVPELDPILHPKLDALFLPIIMALQSSFAVIRHSAAKCLAALCDVMLNDGMKKVVDDVVPLVGDATRVSSRQGAVEAIHHTIKILDIKALPYVLFLIVPILGRMSDPNEHVRLLSTSSFASLVKMVPLEAGIPDPEGFSPELLAKRDEERKFLMQLLDGSKAEQYQIPVKVEADLRQYQKDGVSWLAFLAKYQLHGILCDDMGLGKSLQSICIIASKHHERASRHASTKSVDTAHLPSMIVCPPTLTGHWYHEILKFTPHLKPMQYVGNASERSILRSRIRYHDVIITSYESVRSDITELTKFNFLYCVLDEGHIIKNAKTKLSVAVKQIKAQHRLLLSGTPIQNNVLELWSLFDFLMPGFLGSERVFNDRFSKPILVDREGKATPKEREAASSALEALHKQVLPFLLRRLKEDVLHDLPPKIIQDYYCELSSVQKHLYDEFSKSQAAQEAGEEVSTDIQENSGKGAGQGHVFQSLQYLRKLCNHPALVLDQQPDRFKQIQKKLGVESGAGVGGLHDISIAPKMEALKQLLSDCGIGQTPDKLSDDVNQHRVLIFCQLRPMLDLIEKDLFGSHMPSVSYMRLDGSTDPKKRHAIVQTFNQDPRIDVLLLTTSVGGLGLNLTGADTVIFVDHDWNPMKDLQAMDRAHRLGQRKVVNVYRLITRGTLEEKIMGLQRFKLNIASSVVTQQNAGLGSMNTGEVLDLFKVSAEGEPVKPKTSTSSGPTSMSKMLEGLDDLPPEEEYAELSLDNFLSKV